jgi:hypothetical protein
MLQGLSRTTLASEAGLHSGILRRYEEPGCDAPAKPGPETWLALNAALGYEVPSPMDLVIWLMVGESAKADRATKSALDELRPSIEDIQDYLERNNHDVTIYRAAPQAPPAYHNPLEDATPEEKIDWFKAELAKLRLVINNLPSHKKADQSFYLHALSDLKLAQAVLLTQDEWFAAQTSSTKLLEHS